ncbi:aminotransferase family protein (LolT) [Diplocarpon rosae]|nr:aminotransferase family protein (LolT) [Diplocarpon rosae]
MNISAEEKHALMSTRAMDRYPQISERSREAIAKLLNCAAPTVVVVPSATTGVYSLSQYCVEIMIPRMRSSTSGTSDFRLHNAGLTAQDHLWRLLEDHRSKIRILLLCSGMLSRPPALRGKRSRLAIFDNVPSLPRVRMNSKSSMPSAKKKGYSLS